MKKIAVALSGGIDSTFTAHLLKEKGQQLLAVHAQFWHHNLTKNSPQEKKKINRIKKLCDILDIPLKIIDLRAEHKKLVVDYFLEQYQQGLAPNPCILCNKKIKFGLLLKKIRKLGYDQIATGHYVNKIVLSSNNLDTNHKIPTFMATAKDLSKDQSYFLYLLDQDILNHCLFPLSKTTKQEVRTQFRQTHLPLPSEEESSNICFLKGIKTRNFLKKCLHVKKGDIINQEKKPIGFHMGTSLYTIGQRSGLNIQKDKVNNPRYLSQNNLKPLYVYKKFAQENQIMIGIKEDLYQNTFQIQLDNIVAQETSDFLNQLDIINTLNPRVKIRNTGQFITCNLHQVNNDQNHSHSNRPSAHSKTTLQPKLTISTHKTIFAIAPGQSAVIYLDSTSFSQYLREIFTMPEPTLKNFLKNNSLLPQQYVCLGGGQII